MKNDLKNYAKQFVQKVCVDTWGMNEQEVKNYCLMLVKQNVAMSHIHKDYLQTAVAFAPYAGINETDFEQIINGVTKDLCKGTCPSEALAKEEVTL